MARNPPGIKNFGQKERFREDGALQWIASRGDGVHGGHRPREGNTTMDYNKTRFVAVAALALAVEGTSADVLTVNRDEPLEISNVRTVTGVVAHDRVTVKSGGDLRIQNGTQAMRFGVGSGDVASLVIEHGGKFTAGADEATGLIVGGTPASPAAVYVKGNFWMGIYPYWMQLSADASSSGDEIDFLRIESSSGSFTPTSCATIQRLVTLNAKPAVVTFAGMGLLIPNLSMAFGAKVENPCNKFVFRSYGGNPLCFMSAANWDRPDAAWAFPFDETDEGTIEFDNGSAPVLFGPKGFRNSDGREFGGNAVFRKAYDSGNLVWSGTGPVCFTNFSLTVQARNALPYREDAAIPLFFGFHRGTVSGVGTNVVLDVNGQSAKVGALTMGPGTFVTNTAARAGTLVFGADGLASTLSGEIADSVAIGKAAGNGTLTVGDAAGGTWTTAATPVSTNDVAHFFEKTSTVGNAWTGLIQEMDLVSAQSVAIAGSLELRAASGETNGTDNVSFSGAGTLRKTGAGLSRVAGAATLPSRLDVADGTLAICGRGDADKFWRFTFDFSNISGNQCNVGKLGLFDKDGNWVARGLSFAGQGLAASSLSAGTFTFSSGLAYDTTATQYTESPGAIFNSTYGKFGLKVTNLKSYKTESGSSAFTLTARLADDANPVCWFSTYRQFEADYAANSIMVESSPDGVSGWRKVAECAEKSLLNGANYTWTNDRSWGSKTVSLNVNQTAADFTLYSGMPFAVAASGAVAAPATGSVAVRVASGATLDLSSAAGVAANIVEVDWTDLGGTIRGAAIPANGTLALSNVPQGANLYETPLLTLPTATGKANFGSWTVMVNGVAKDCRVRVDSTDALLLDKSATVLSIR